MDPIAKNCIMNPKKVGDKGKYFSFLKKTPYNNYLGIDAKKWPLFILFSLLELLEVVSKDPTIET